MKNGNFVDAAIHGVSNNINQVLDIFKPKKIYCLGSVGSTIDAFINYIHQPFYASLYGKIVYVNCTSMQKVISKIIFCAQNQPFCSICRCLDTIMIFYNQLSMKELLPIIYKPIVEPKIRS